MKEKMFLPLLAPNKEIDLNTISYPVLGSYKLDGCRLLIKQGQLLTRSLKQLPNKQLREKFEIVRKYTEENNIFFDGEIYAPGIPFQFIVSCFMTEDYNNKLSIKKWDELCEEHNFFMSRQEVFEKLMFYCFDCVQDDNFEQRFQLRQVYSESGEKYFPNLIKTVEHVFLSSPEAVIKYFEEALSKGLEGLILRNPNGIYKFDRATIKQNIIFKLKPWETVDSKIIGFIQATKVNEDVEKTINEKGRSVTSKKEADRHLIDKAQAFVVDFEGKELSVPIALPDEKKIYIWKNQEEFVGKYLEYKFMTVGIKTLPRIPKMIRLREDK